MRVDVCASQREIHPAGVVCMVTGECAHICLCLLCCCCLAVRARCPVESNSLNFFDIITCRITHVCQVLLFVKRRIPPPPPPPPLHARTTDGGASKCSLLFRQDTWPVAQNTSIQFLRLLFAPQACIYNGMFLVCKSRHIPRLRCTYIE